MKKLSSLLIAALVAACAFAANAIADTPTKVDSEVTIKFDAAGTGPYDPYSQSRFFGKVTGEGEKACKVSRKVLVKRVGGGTLGGTRTDAKGRWELDVAEVGGFQPGEYFATVKKKRIKVGKGDDHTHFKCKKAQSAAITVP